MAFRTAAFGVIVPDGAVSGGVRDGRVKGQDGEGWQNGRLSTRGKLEETESIRATGSTLETHARPA
jgi:hypothetical protein